MKYKNLDGTLNHFEMKGGPYEGWLRELRQIQYQLETSRNVFAEIDKTEIDATAVVWPLLDSFSKRLDKMVEMMKQYRQEQFSGS